MLELERSSLGQFVTRLAVRIGAGDWSTLVVADRASISTTVGDLAFEAELATGVPVATLSVVNSAGDLVAQIDDTDAGVVIISVGEGARRDLWQGVDLLRDQLARTRSLVFVLTPAEFMALRADAPSVAAMIGSAAYALDEDTGVLSDAARAERLAALRAEYGLTDDELVERVTHRTQPIDPHIAEWLALLGRGDLIGDGR